MGTNGTTAPFCPDPLWDADLTWHTDDPDFTVCFQQTVELGDQLPYAAFERGDSSRAIPNPPISTLSNLFFAVSQKI